MEKSIILCYNCSASDITYFDEFFNDLWSRDFENASDSSISPAVSGATVTRTFLLNTKYYTAEVNLCKLVDKNEFKMIKNFSAENVEALIVHFHGNENFFDHVTDLLRVYSPSVRILHCRNVIGGGEQRKHHVIEWCVKNEFELVESEPDEETRAEAAECREIFGVDRILQILKAHAWPDMQMKDEKIENENRAKRLNALLFPDGELENQENHTNGHCDDASILENSASTTVLQPENANFSENDGDFEKLFANFAALKATAGTLPAAERKKFAEKVTMEFWRALGGIDDEIAGLSSSGDED